MHKKCREYSILVCIVDRATVINSSMRYMLVIECESLLGKTTFSIVMLWWLMSDVCVLLMAGIAVARRKDYDSGTHEMCSHIGPPISLYKLLEEQYPDMLQMYMFAVESRNCKDILPTADAVSWILTRYYCVSALCIRLCIHACIVRMCACDVCVFVPR